MNEEKVKKLKELKKEIVECNRIINKNHNEMEELSKNVKVRRYIELLNENEEQERKITGNEYNQRYLIKNNCPHKIVAFVNSDYDGYEGRRYNYHKCLECGEYSSVNSNTYIINIFSKNKHLSFDKLRKEYLALSLKYKEEDVLEIMRLKYIECNKMYEILQKENFDDEKILRLIKYNKK